MLANTATQLFMRQQTSRHLLFRTSTSIYQMQSMTFTRCFRKILLI